MKIHLVYERRDVHAGEIVALALIRSFTPAQLLAVPKSDSLPTAARAAVWINPRDSAAAEITRLVTSGGKAVVLGRLGKRVAAALGLEWHGDEALPAEWAQCTIDPLAHHDASPAEIRYRSDHALARVSPLRVRPLCRFDFANEWNNLGFGRITLDRGPWSLQSLAVTTDAIALAALAAPTGDEHVYASLLEGQQGAALWFNRSVGPVDSLEWRVIEAFLGDYRPDDLPCFPYVSEVPAGCLGAVNARLDCDEAVAASRPLAELYQQRGRPLSLALLTGQRVGQGDLHLMRELIARGGSVVSHSVRHEPNWGGTYERARDEALQSRMWFDKHLAEATPMRFAVSPFHQNPPYAVAGLADAGYAGFVGGIIANDPEYLLGRAGRVPFVQRPIVSLSAQSMLHGDCYQRQNQSIEVHCDSFDQHFEARSIFGYLDHPFSERYQYGWQSEETRLDAHRRLIEHIDRHEGIWWASLNEVMDFLCQRDAALVEAGGRSTLLVQRPEESRPLAISWKGKQFAH